MTNLTNGTMTIKVGQMPGKLTEVIVNNGTSAREIFEIAGVEVSNHEVRLDGTKIDMDSNVSNGRLLVAMKMIKGNATIKVGQMPGKLTEVESNNETARDIFQKAGVEVSNHEVRLDGVKIDLDTNVGEGRLLVAMKMIKGNREIYVTTCTKEEVQHILGVEIPEIIETKDVIDAWEDTLEVFGNIVDENMFLSIYELTEEEELNNEQEIDTQKVDTQKDITIEGTCNCTHKKAIDVIRCEIQQTEEKLNVWQKYAQEEMSKLSMLNDLLEKVQG